MGKAKIGWLIMLAAACLAGSVFGCNRQRRLAEVVHPEVSVEAVSTAESLGNPWQAEEESEAALFADDRGERLLANLLPPSETPPGISVEKHSPRVPFSTSSSLEMLKTRMPPAHVELPQPRASIAGSKKPTALLPEGMPLAFSRAEPVTPERRDLPAGERVRVAFPRLDGPLPLPPLATPYQEPLATEDPTGEYSLAAALAAPPPKRTSSAPFLRLTIPDPFEHRPAARLRSEWKESSVPLTSSPRPPR
jgi:hypothetical protein